MNVWAVARKSLREQARDPVGLGLTLFTTPVLVLFFWIVFRNESEARVLVATGPHVGCTSASPAPSDPARALLVLQRSFEGPLLGTRRLRLERASSLPESERALRAGEAVAALVLEPRPSVGADACETRVRVLARRPDPTAALIALLAERALSEKVDPAPVSFLDGATALGPLETGLPPLLVFSTIMLVFSAAMAVAKEVEAGTLLRLRMTPLRSIEFLGGISLHQAGVGACTTTLSFVLAMALGLRVRGSLLASFLALAFAGIGCAGLGMVVASRARTVQRAFLVASGLMLALMLFSGVVFPLPQMIVARPWGLAIEPYDLLPTRHAVSAIHACVTEGASLEGVAGRLFVAALESAIAFLAGVLLFEREWRRGV